MIAPVQEPKTEIPRFTQGRPVEELLKTVSASRLQTWQQCRLKFWFRYVEGIAKPTTPALFVGRTVHGVLQAWNLARWRKESVSPERLQAVFERLWIEGQAEQKIAWDSAEQDQKQTAWAMLAAYFHEAPIPFNERPEGVEVSVEADLARHGLPKLVGIIDLVRAGGRIVDFKTTAQTPHPEKVAHLAETQIACYALMYRESTGNREAGMELHHLVKLKTPKVIVTPLAPMNETQETRLLRVIQSYVDGLARRDIIPAPGLHCHSCEFFHECRHWG